MQKKENHFFASAMSAKKNASTGVEKPPPQRPLGEFARRLRPYRDVRASFEPWRRTALRVWASGEEAISVH